MSKTFGGPAYGSYTGMRADSKYVDRFQASEAGRAIAVEVLCAAGDAPAKFKGVVYSDSASEANALLGTGSEVSLATGTSPLWRRSTLVTPFNFASGQWLHFGPLTNSGYFHVYRGTTTGHSSYADDTYAAAENPFGAHDSLTWRLSVRLVYDVINVPPNAPTLLSPINLAQVEVSQAQTFKWTFSDADVGDVQSALQLRHRILGAASWTTRTVVTSPYEQTTIPGGTFADGETHEWQERTADRANTWGPYSASGFFVGVLTPDVPIIISPASEATITDIAGPIVYTATLQDAFEARRVNDVDGVPGVTIYEDSGTVADTESRQFGFTLDTSGRWEWWQVRTQHNASWSAYAGVRVYVDFTPPATPTVIVTAVSGVAGVGGYISVSASHPEPTGDRPTVTGMDIWRSDAGAAYFRIAKDLEPTATWIDWVVADGVDHTYAVDAIGDNGARVLSAVAYMSPSDAEIVVLL